MNFKPGFSPSGHLHHIERKMALLRDGAYKKMMASSKPAQSESSTTNDAF
jgi:hypothetical protein